ncbi:MAG: MATE family efflux transporter [Clostridia bacterium]|nr:MATE family efflux transporter [Lachnospiraceae bacterium]NCC00086.1 MATE family efflux transporter [Clostridia bacterium]NCD01651.1 MATE family efflux transporter [Clostridia bacterium]
MSSNIRQLFIKYVSANILGMIGLSCYILADTFFIARGVGADGLTALNLTIPVYSLIHGTGLMIGMGGATRFSITKSTTVFTQALYFLCMAAALFVAAGIFLPGYLAGLLGADSATFGYTATYLRIILCFSPMFLTNNLVLCFVRTDGGPHLAMAGMIIGSLSNIVLDYILVFPMQMGMLGAAIATGLAPIISLLILSSHFYKKHNTFKLVSCRPEFRMIKDIVSLGSASLITEISSGVVILVFNVIILRLTGNLGVAAYGIVVNIALVVTSVFTGISQGIQPILSQSYGRGEKDNIKKLLKYGICLALGISIVVYGLSFVFAQPMADVFNRDMNPELSSMAVTGLRIYFTSFFFAGLNIIIAIYFSSVDKPQKAFLLSMLRGIVVIIPVAFIMSALWGMTGVWMSLTVSEAIVFGISMKGDCPF